MMLILELRSEKENEYKEMEKKVQNTFIAIEEILEKGNNSSAIYRSESLRRQKHDPTQKSVYQRER